MVFQPLPQIRSNAKVALAWIGYAPQNIHVGHAYLIEESPEELLATV